MHLSFPSLVLATGFATLSHASRSSPFARLDARSTASTSTVATSSCVPETSEYLYSVTADGLSKFGFMAHYSYIRLATDIYAPGFADDDDLVWNLVKGSDDHLFKLQTPDGGKCAVVRGPDRKVGLSDCSSPAAELEIACQSCGKTSCGDPYASKCTIKSTSISSTTNDGDRGDRGGATNEQCLTRDHKLIMTRDCDERDKKQKWTFALA
ncbi:hypothetical protein JCM10212_006868 [Sporobolomyces blumeae]